MNEDSKSPATGGANQPAFGRGTSNRDWWPNQLTLVKVLHQNCPMSNPLGKEFNYAEEFKKLYMKALKKHLYALMTDSQGWWPADFGHYGGLLHSDGVAQRRHLPHRRRPRGRGLRRPTLCAPQQLARQRESRQGAPARLIKQKYARKISWA